MLAHLRAFLMVVEAGSLNRAAARLRTSQSALSRQMQALENEVGGALLERTSAGVRPTDAGHALAASAPGVLAAYDDALERAGQLARGLRSQLRVGYLASAARTYLDPALGALRRAHPAVKVELLDLSPGEQLAALRRGALDVAVVGQEGCHADAEFYTRKLATLPLVAILPADHPLAGRVSIALAALRAERFVRSPEADLPGRDRWITQLCRKAGFRARFTRRPGESLSHGLTLVAAEGLAMLAPAYLLGVHAAGVATVPVSDPWASWDFLVVWQRGRTAASVRAFLDALAATAEEVCRVARTGG